MLDRYKKQNGFNQLLNLIETSGKQKQEQFLNLIKAESPLWEETIRRKLLSVDKILSWEGAYLSEIFTRVQPLTLATALRDLPKDRYESVMSCLSMGDRRKIQQVIDETKPTPAEVSTCMMKLISETRGMIKDGILKMDKVDPELAVPEDIEERLASGSVGMPKVEASGSSSATVAASPAGEAPADAGGLRFELRADSGDTEHLKKKVNQLVAENTSLKHEVAVLRGKLEQIKKIA